jgi:hypothetical protein
MSSEIDALANKVQRNKTLLAQSRANIEQNRLLVMSNYVAAMSGNHQLALHNTETIFSARDEILGAIDAVDDEHAKYIDAARVRSQLDLIAQNALLNRRNIELNKQLVGVNDLLIKINEQIMRLNQDVIEFSEDNLKSNNELIDGGLHSLLVDDEMTSELVEQNEKVLAELRELAGENSNIVFDLLAKSKENRLLALANAEKISKRKERLYRNREDIDEMVKRIGAPISLAELFDVDDREL